MRGSHHQARCYPLGPVSQLHRGKDNQTTREVHLAAQVSPLQHELEEEEVAGHEVLLVQVSPRSLLQLWVGAPVCRDATRTIRPARPTGRTTNPTNVTTIHVPLSMPHNRPTTTERSTPQMDWGMLHARVEHTFCHLGG